ncbi:MAG TPA: hypothetical protein VMQ17_16855 [Candidatus Sulfotelmatobacter sp.]|nr:hypothetical protein [Candidatus Sulfotelmatobacter sp.]
MDLLASAWNTSGTPAAVSEHFRWQAEPAGSNTASPSGTLNLLYASGAAAPAETGLNIASNGNITFAAGQAFPGTGPGTVSSVASGAGLIGGPITSSGTLSIATGGITNAMLVNPTLSVLAGTDLAGGGSVPLGGSTTLNLDTTKVPQLNTANTFTGSQTVNGNLTATGVVSGGGFQIGSKLFDYGSFSAQNAFLGFAGNTTTTGIRNTASGYQALGTNTNGASNTAIGFITLNENTTGVNNTAVGAFSGATRDASNITGASNTFLGYGAALGTGSISNSAAIGVLAEADQSNSIVLGGINGVNGATVSTSVGIGTTKPPAQLSVSASGRERTAGYSPQSDALSLISHSEPPPAARCRSQVLVRMLGITT